jgi:GNAT superfamily N-acetyltransferase
MAGIAAAVPAGPPAVRGGGRHPEPLPAPPPARRPAAPAPAAAPAPPSPAQPAARPLPLEVRQLRPYDLPSILELANADLLAGQPRSMRDGLEMALRAESPVDSTWWQQLANIQVLVVTRGGTVAGAASYAVAPADRSGWLLWLHGREDREVVRILVDQVLDELSGCSHVYAFFIATALTLGLEALPVRRRPVTHAVLREHGLVGRDSWRYLVVPLDRAVVEAGTDEVAGVAAVSAPGETPTWRLTVGDPDRPIATAEVALGREGCGILWWIEVEPGQRGRGIGRRLLLQALRFLALRGARTMAALVDHDSALEAERRPALRLFASVGFQAVDELWSYESPRRRSR